MWLRYGVRYGALRWCVTVSYGGALRLCVTMRYFDALRRCVTVRYGGALRLCVTVRYGYVTVSYASPCSKLGLRCHITIGKTLDVDFLKVSI